MNTDRAFCWSAVAERKSENLYPLFPCKSVSYSILRGFSIRTLRIIWPWFRSSVHRSLHFALSAATTIKASQKDNRLVMEQSIASLISTGVMMTVSNLSSDLRMSLIISGSAPSLEVDAT